MIHGGAPHSSCAARVFVSSARWLCLSCQNPPDGRVPRPPPHKGDNVENQERMRRAASQPFRHSRLGVRRPASKAGTSTHAERHVLLTKRIYNRATNSVATDRHGQPEILPARGGRFAHASPSPSAIGTMPMHHGRAVTQHRTQARLPASMAASITTRILPRAGRWRSSTIRIEFDTPMGTPP